MNGNDTPGATDIEVKDAARKIVEAGVADETAGLEAGDNGSSVEAADRGASEAESAAHPS